MIIKNRFFFYTVLILFTLTKAYSQQGKLMDDLSKKGYKFIFCETHELLKARIDTTKALKKKVVYSKIGDVIYGVIYQDKYYNGDSFFHENSKTGKLYLYHIDYLDIPEGPVSYDTYINNFYSCYNVDFKNDCINEYNVSPFLKNGIKTIVTSSFKNDTITQSAIWVNEEVSLPNFNDVNSLKNYDVDFNTMKYQKKVIGEPKIIENYRPLIFYYFVCLLESCPTKCSDKDFLDAVF